VSVFPRKKANRFGFRKEERKMANLTKTNLDRDFLLLEKVTGVNTL
jgi:hypothetical protein